MSLIFMGLMFMGRAVGSAAASLAWEFAGWLMSASFGAASRRVIIKRPTTRRVALRERINRLPLMLTG
jgi:hypothetical protein